MTTDLHKALTNAQGAERDRVMMVNANFKINPLKKEMAEQICAKNGTTISAFLRECIQGLLVDYAGEKAVKELEK